MVALGFTIAELRFTSYVRSLNIFEHLLGWKESSLAFYSSRFSWFAVHFRYRIRKRFFYFVRVP